MMKHTFILNDESVNRYGYRILNAGLDTSGYMKNPVVLVMHNTSSYGNWVPVGKTTNIYMEGNLLKVDMELDEEDEMAVKLHKKLSKGYLSAVSLNARDILWSDDPTLMLPGQLLPTLVASELLEISLVSIPGQRNAVRLTSADGVVVLASQEEVAKRLKEKMQSQKLSTNDMKQIITTIGSILLSGAPVVSLAQEATETEVSAAVGQLGAKLLSIHTENGQLKTKLADLETQLLSLQKQATTDKATALVQGAIDAGKIAAAEKDSWVKLAIADHDAAAKALQGMSAYTPASQQINQPGKKQGKDILALSWDEADKGNHLAELKAKYPARYQEIFNQKFNK